MEKELKISASRWSPKVKYDKTSTCRFKLSDKKLNAKFKIESISPYLEPSFEGSTLSITPSSKADEDSYVTISARVRGKVVAKETFDIKVNKSNKNAVALGLSLGLGIPAIVGVGIGVIGLSLKNKKGEDEQGEYVVSNPVNCEISREDDKVVIYVTDPTQEATVDISYKGDSSATFSSDHSTITFKDANTLSIPANTSSESTISLNISASGKKNKLKMEIVSSTQPEPTTSVTLYNLKAVENTGVEVAKSTKSITYTRNDASAGQFTLDLSKSLSDEGSWVIKIDGETETDPNPITASLSNKTLTLTIPKTHGDLTSKSITISNNGSTPDVEPWSGKLTIKDAPTPPPVTPVNLSNPTSLTTTTLVVSGTTITYTKSEDADGVFTLDLSDSLTVEGNWVVTVNGGTESGAKGISTSLSGTKLTLTIPKNHEDVTSKTIVVSNTGSTPTVNPWSGTLSIITPTPPPVIDPINLTNPTAVTEDTVAITGTAIRYTRGEAASGKFTLDLSDTLTTAGTWVVKIDNATDTDPNPITVSLTESQKITVTIPKSHSNLTTATITISNEGSSPDVNPWSGTLSIEDPTPPPVTPIDLINPTEVSNTGVTITGNAVTFTKGEYAAGQFTLDLTDSLTDEGAWVVEVDGTPDPDANPITASLSGTKLTISIPNSHNDVSAKSLTISNSTATPTVNSWTGTITIVTPEPPVKTIDLRNPIAITTDTVSITGTITDPLITYTKGDADEARFTLDLSDSLDVGSEGEWAIQLGTSWETGDNAITASSSGKLLTVVIPKGHANVTEEEITISNNGSSPAVNPWTANITIQGDTEPVEDVTLSNLTAVSTNVSVEKSTNVITYTKTDKNGKFTLDLSNGLTNKGTWSISVDGKAEEGGVYPITASLSGTKLTVEIPAEHENVPAVPIIITNTGSTPTVKSWSGTLTIQTYIPPITDLSLINPTAVTTDTVEVGLNNSITYTKGTDSAGVFTLDLDGGILTNEGTWIVKINNIVESEENDITTSFSNNKLTITIPKGHDIETSAALTIANNNCSPSVTAWNGSITIKNSGITLDNPQGVANTRVVTGTNNTVGYTQPRPESTQVNGQFTLTADKPIETTTALNWSVKVGDTVEGANGISAELDPEDNTRVIVTIPSDREVVALNTPITITCTGATLDVTEWVGKLTIKAPGVNSLTYEDGGEVVVGDLEDEIDPNIFCTAEETIYNVPFINEGTGAVSYKNIEKSSIQGIVLESILPTSDEIEDNFLTNCPNLSSIDIKGLSNITKIGNDFLSKCTSEDLETVDLSGLINVTSIADRFMSGAKSASSGGTVTHKMHVKTMDFAWLSNVRSIGNDFIFIWTDIEEIKNLDTLTSITEIGEHFFAYIGSSDDGKAEEEQTTIKHVDLSAFKNVTAIGRSFFSHSKHVESIDLSGFKSVTWIGHYFLGSCESLKEVDMSNFVTIDFIDYYYLADCDVLERVYLPNKDPSTIVFGTDPDGGSIHFMSNTPNNVELRAPNLDLADKYRATSPWSERYDYITPTE